MSQLLDRRDGRSCARTRTGAGSVARRILTLVLAAAAALVMGVLGPPVASASEAQVTPAAVLSAESAAAAQASPLCGGTTSHGKIVYQSCVRFNCDRFDCYVRAIAGIINKATGPRTVNWNLRYQELGMSLPVDEAQGQITIPAGEQRTVISPIVHRIDCPTGWAYGGAQVNYDSTGWSPVTESQTLWPDCQ